MGLIWALFSVGTASGAQLLLRSAMVELPPLTDIFTFLNHLLHLRAGTFGGVRAYGLPAVDGLLVLRSASTAAGESLRAAEPELHLVWAAAIWLPGWHEPFHWQSLLGVLLIVAGVLTIFWPVKRQG